MAARSTAGRRRGGVRLLAGLALSLGLLATSACGMDVQTNQPYTPAEGINVDVGNSADPNAVVHVRNLSIISRTKGTGILSGSIVCYGRDTLTAVTGKAIKVDGTEGSPLVVAIPAAVAVGNGTNLVLTDRSPIAVTSADLDKGLSVTITLTFSSAGQTTLKVPVVDGNEAQYASITPAPASPSATP